MIVRGLWLLARGRRAGVKEFENSLDGFAASLAPLIAFPLVGAAVAVMQGAWQEGVIDLLSRLCAILAVPVIIHEFARRTGREAWWLRTITALDWSFWVVVPLLVVASIGGALLVTAGLPLHSAAAVMMGVCAGYLLWLHFIIVRAGLGVTNRQAVLVVAAMSAAILFCSIGPLALDYAWYGKAVFKPG
jgi:hypothetical protein